MPSKEECFFLGYISKPFGYKGELIVSLEVDDKSLYSKIDAVFVEVKGVLMPYFIKEIRPRDKDMLWRFEGISADEARLLAGCELYLPLTLLPSLEGNKFYFHEVIGFTVEDKEQGNIGILKEIYDQGPQPVLSIDCKGKEIMIPLIDDFLLEVDRENKILKVAAPEGLINFYLS